VFTVHLWFCAILSQIFSETMLLNLVLVLLLMSLILYCRGGQTFFLAGQISMKYWIAGRKKKFLPYFFLRKDVNWCKFWVFFYINASKIAELCIQNLTQGPQKIFGGPHAARGPHFGHPCYIAFSKTGNFFRVSKLGQRWTKTHLRLDIKCWDRFHYSNEFVYFSGICSCHVPIMVTIINTDKVTLICKRNL